MVPFPRRTSRSSRKYASSTDNRPNTNSKPKTFQKKIGDILNDFSGFKDVKEDIIKALDEEQEHHSYKICALFVTNIITNDSNVLYSTRSKELIRIAYGLQEIEEGQLLKGVMSRKKQMVPNLMSVIDHS